MKFQSIEKKQEGNFIHRYDITYRTEGGREKVYEMISRDPSVETLSDLRKEEPDAVVLIIHDESGERLLLNREFRLALGAWVYNFPAGLIDAGETPEQSAARELREETGLHLVRITDTLPLSYSAVGFSNETNVCIVGTAAGTFRDSSSDVEEIQAAWFTKQEVRELLRTEPFAARTQAYCYLWSMEPDSASSKGLPSGRRPLVYEQVRSADRERIQTLSALASAIVKEHYDPILGAAQNDYMIRKFQSPEAISEQLGQGYQYYLVCTEAGKGIGFIAFYPRGEELYLSKFYLSREQRGKGLSRDMMGFVVEHARQYGLPAVVLNVNRFNEIAIRAYRNLGFHKIRDEVTEIGEGYVMDDYVLEYRIQTEH